MDPFLQEIEERLSGDLDPHTFEACACSLLNAYFPGISPVRGGSDAGMDGAIPDGEDQPLPLIVTTAKNPLPNLQRSIKSYLKHGLPRRRAVFATSQALTPRQRRKLEEIAESSGFRLLQIYDQAWLADQLYTNPRWLKSLLGIAPDSPALTSVPPGNIRSILGDEIVGRESEIQWLTDSSGDILLIGQPGSGKSFILRHLARKGWGLFVATDDITAIQAEFRKKRPKTLIVDDAHSKRDLIEKLLHLRAEKLVDFDLALASWPGSAAPLQAKLRLPTEQILELPLFDLETMERALASWGIKGPAQLVRVILQQSRGHVGLASTLAHVAMNGDVDSLLKGKAIALYLTESLSELIDPAVKSVLAAFALGGDWGIPRNAVASFLEIPKYKLGQMLDALAAAGVIQDHGGEEISVWPEALRWALVEEVFFSSVGGLDYLDLMGSARPLSGVSRTLSLVHASGVRVPRLLEILEQSNDAETWSIYAGTGRTEALTVLQRHPEHLLAISSAALQHAEREVLRALMSKAVGDTRPTNSHPDHPLRKIEDWIKDPSPQPSEALRRRSTLIDVALQWLREDEDADLGFKALVLSLAPDFFMSEMNATGTSLMLSFGLLSEEYLERLTQLWPGVLETLSKISVISWPSLFDLVECWLHPPLNPSADYPESTRRLTQTFAISLLRDIQQLCGDHRGVLHHVADIAQHWKLGLEVELDQEFETIFPLEKDLDSFDEQEKRWLVEIRRLAADWATRTPREVAETIKTIEQEALEGSVQTWPRLMSSLCFELAGMVTKPVAWANQFIESGCTPEVISPFVEQTCKSAPLECGPILSKCLEYETYRGIAVDVGIRLEVLSTDLYEAISPHLSQHAGIINIWCLRSEIGTSTLSRLLAHADRDVATAAGVGHWLAKPRGDIDNSVKDLWRRAIINSEPEDHWIGEILKSDGELALEWLVRWLDAENMRFRYTENDTVGKAISCLTTENRTRLIQLISSRRNARGLTSTVAQVVGDDIDAYECLLRETALERLHLAPIYGRPTEQWIRKVQVAVRYGHSPEAIAEAAMRMSDVVETRWGKISDIWGDWIAEFERLLDNPATAIQQIAKHGIAVATRLRDNAARRERNEDIYGL